MVLEWISHEAFELSLLRPTNCCECYSLTLGAEICNSRIIGEACRNIEFTIPVSPLITYITICRGWQSSGVAVLERGIDSDEKVDIFSDKSYLEAKRSA